MQTIDPALGRRHRGVRPSSWSRRHREASALVADAEDESPKKAAAVIRRAGLDLRRLSHPGSSEPGTRPGGQRASAERREPNRRPDHRVRRVDAFVYIHIAWFSCWIAFGVEHYPYGC